MMRKLRDLELGGKTVFVRVDFNVPIDDGKIGEPHRIDSAVPTTSTSSATNNIESFCWRICVFIRKKKKTMKDFPGRSRLWRTFTSTMLSARHIARTRRS